MTHTQLKIKAALSLLTLIAISCSPLAESYVAAPTSQIIRAQDTEASPSQIPVQTRPDPTAPPTLIHPLTVTPKQSPTPAGWEMQIDVHDPVDMDWSPDAERIALATKEGLLLVGIGDMSQIDRCASYVQRGTSPRTGTVFIKTDAALNSVDISPDSQLVAAETRGYFVVWQSNCGMKLLEQFFTINFSGPIKFVDDQALMVTQYYLTDNLVVQVFRPWDGKGSAPVFLARFDPHAGFALSDHGRFLAFKTRRGLEIWMADEQAPMTVISQDIGAYTFSPESEIIAGVNSSECEVVLWKVSTGSVLDRFSWCELDLPGDTEFGKLVFHPEGSMIAVASLSGEVIVWDITSAELLQVIYASNDRVIDVEFSHVGDQLAVLTEQTGLTIWRIE